MLAVDERPQRGQHQGQRRAQLVVDVGEELGLQLVQGLELEVGLLELGRGLLQGHPAAQLAAADGVHDVGAEDADQDDGRQEEEVGEDAPPVDGGAGDVEEAGHGVAGPDEGIQDDRLAEGQRHDHDHAHG